MLQELFLSNFKVFDESGAKVRFGRVTLLIGPNGCGKTSILQALSIAKESAAAKKLTFDSWQGSLGAFRDFVHRHEATNEIGIGFKVSHQGLGMHSEPSLEKPGFIGYKGSFSGTKHIQSHGRIQSGETRIDIPTRASSNNASSIAEVRSLHQIVSLSPSDEFAQPFKVTLNPLRGPRRDVAGVDTDAPAQKPSLAHALTRFASQIPDALARLHFVPALRGFGNLSYGIVNYQEPIDPRYLTLSDPQQQSTYATNILAARPEVADELADIIDKVLNQSGLRVRTRLRGTQLGVETVADGLSVSMANEALGLNQLVAPLLLLLLVPTPNVIAIEEPELHLHPRAQSSLCDFFVEFVRDTERQLVLTTHSEHVLMSFLTAVADGRIAPNDLSVCELEREHSHTRTTELEVNSNGQISGGLRQFLEVDIDEIGRLIDARLAGKAV